MEFIYLKINKEMNIKTKIIRENEYNGILCESIKN